MENIILIFFPRQTTEKHLKNWKREQIKAKLKYCTTVFRERGLKGAFLISTRHPADETLNANAQNEETRQLFADSKGIKNSFKDKQRSSLLLNNLLNRCDEIG